MPTQLTVPSRPILAPYVTAWSTERSLPANVITVPGVGIAYADETITDRDRNGVLWSRVAISPGKGRPDFGRVHPQRQRRAMLRLLCQVCGGPADQNDDGVLWLIRDFRDDWPGWPDMMAVTEPPICRPCVQTSLDRCPALRKGAVTIRARRYPVAAARGALYAGPEPTYIDNATIPLNDPKIRWLRAINLVRELNDCTIIPPDEIGSLRHAQAQPRRHPVMARRAQLVHQTPRR